MFEEALIESSRKKRSTARWWTFPVAVGMHLVILAVAAFAHFWHVEELPEPAIQVSFMSAPPPPPPPPPPPKGRPKRPKPTIIKPKIVTPNLQPVQPVIVPDNVPEPEVPDMDVDMPEMDFEDEGSEYGVEGGVEGGVAGGVVGGVEGGVVGGAITDEEPIRVEGAVTQPEIVKRVEPKYTEMARRARISGVVIVEAIIDKTGSVTNGRVLRGLGGGLNEEALRAIEQWKFKPATLNGRPVTVYFTLTITFRIR